MTKVSVVVPVYNVERYLGRCLDSLVSQTLRDVEIICVDDGSTDRSGAIADEYAARSGRVKVVHKANSGAGPARNAGMDVAVGEYLYFCDPDDWADEGMLDALYGRASETAADVVIAGRKAYSEETNRVFVNMPSPELVARGVFSGQDLPDNLFTQAKAALWDKLFSRKLIVDNGIRFQAVPHTNDLFFTAAALSCARRITAVPKAFYYHRFNRADSLQNTKDRHPLAFLDVWRALSSFLGEKGLSGVYARAMSGLLLRGGVRELTTLKKKENAWAFFSEFQPLLKKSVLDSGMQDGKGLLSPFEARLLAHALRDPNPRRILLLYKYEMFMRRCARIAKRTAMHLLGRRDTGLGDKLTSNEAG